MTYADKLYHLLMFIIALRGEKRVDAEWCLDWEAELTASDTNARMVIGYNPSGNYACTGCLLQVTIYGDVTSAGDDGNPCIMFMARDGQPGYELIRTHGEFANADYLLWDILDESTALQIVRP